jgi:hypothetical protein
VKRLILLLSLTFTGVAVRAEQSPEDIDRMFGGYLTNHDEWERTYGGYWVVWYLLTKDDPKLTRLYQLYRNGGQKYGFGAAPSFLRQNVYALRLIVDKWNGVVPPIPTSTPTPAPTQYSGAADLWKEGNML